MQLRRPIASLTIHDVQDSGASLGEHQMLSVATLRTGLLSSPMTLTRDYELAKETVVRDLIPGKKILVTDKIRTKDVSSGPGTFVSELTLVFDLPV
jgi:hypothetical protein